MYVQHFIITTIVLLPWLPELELRNSKQHLHDRIEVTAMVIYTELQYETIMHQPVTVSSSMHMQPNIYTNEAFSSTSTRFNPYFGWCCRLYILYTSQSRD